jgi:hypothetical protein
VRPEELYASPAGSAAALRPGEVGFLPEHRTRAVVIGEVLLAALHHARPFRSLAEHVGAIQPHLPLWPAEDPRWRELLDALIAQGLLRSLDRWLADAAAAREAPGLPRALLLLGGRSESLPAWREAVGDTEPQLPLVLLRESAEAGEATPAGIRCLALEALLEQLPSASPLLARLPDASSRLCAAALLLAAGEVVLIADGELSPPLRSFPLTATGVTLGFSRAPEEVVELSPDRAQDAGAAPSPGTIGALLAPLGRVLADWLCELDPLDLAASAHGFAPSLVSPLYFHHRVATVTVGRRGRLAPGFWQFTRPPTGGLLSDRAAYADWLRGPHGASGVHRPKVSIPRLGRLTALDLRRLFPAPPLGMGAGPLALWSETVQVLNPDCLGLSWPLTLGGEARGDPGWLHAAPVGSEEQLLGDWIRRASDLVRAQTPEERIETLCRWLEDYALASEAHLARDLAEYRMMALAEPLRAMGALLQAPAPSGVAEEWREGLAIAFRRLAKGIEGGDEAPIPRSWREPEAVRALARGYARTLAMFRDAYAEALARRPLERLLARG